MKVSPNGNPQEACNSNKGQYANQSHSEPYSFELFLFLILFDNRHVFICLVADALELLDSNRL